MGLFKEIGYGLKKLIVNDPEQYVVGEDKFENELVISMRASGNANITSSDAAILTQSKKYADANAIHMAQEQENSIKLFVSDIVMFARNGFEKWFKKGKSNQLIEELAEKSTVTGKLPKDATVISAESTNGKIKSVAASEKTTREKGGKEREMNK